MATSEDLVPKSEQVCLAPPTEFKRMLSWQLSHPVEPESKTKKRKRKRKKSGAVVDPLPLTPSGSDSNPEDNAPDSFAYIIVNSDGEEELYFSAPESPNGQSSDNEALYSKSGPSLAFAPASAECVELPPQSRKPGGRSKKAKKKAKFISRRAQIEFLQPLCDLFEQKLSVSDVGEMEVSSKAEVPTLAELCIKKIHKLSLAQPESDGLPFLIHSLLAQDRTHRSVVSTHVRWLERLLASFESLSVVRAKYRTPLEPKHKLAYAIQELWEDLSIAAVPEYQKQLHVPLPRVHCFHYESVDIYNEENHSRLFQLRVLFHFTNLMFPLFTTKKPSTDSTRGHLLSSSQLAAIHYVNSFLTTRYKALCVNLEEALKLWPGYVYWARGQLKLAADSFLATLPQLKYSRDQAVLLNEVGRMFSMFGDRASASRFFRQSADVVVERAVFEADPKLVQPCVFSLIAATWDCGFLSGGVAKEAARAWQPVLKEAAASGAWYLHMAACESRLGVHASQPTGVDPNNPTQIKDGAAGGTSLQWLRECQQLLTSLAPSHPILYYHLSLVAAMLGQSHAAREAFNDFEFEYSGFREWPGGVRPGHPFPSSPPLPRSQNHPWLPLSAMLARQKLSHAPTLSPQWRTRLLHPHYPHIQSSCISYLSDHCSPEVGLRFTSDGYLTADLQMDLPPLRCVRLDPYTGALCFTRGAALEHFHCNHFVRGESTRIFPNYPERCVMPWPLRLFESECCVVELLQASTSDFEAWNSHAESSYLLTLHRHDTDGSHRKLDLRKSIRKQLRQAVLDLAEKKGWEDKEPLVDKLMERGLHFDIERVNKKKVIPKYYTRHNKKESRQERLRDGSVRDFSLSLVSYAVFGEATLMLIFSTQADLSTENCHGQALVFVNCASEGSFLRPRVYCVGDHWGFQCLYPDPSTALPAHTGRHFRHIQYASAIRTEGIPRSDQPGESPFRQLVFDVDGEVVFSKHLPSGTRQDLLLERSEMWISATLADRFFRVEAERSGAATEICSYNPQLEDRVCFSLFLSGVVSELVVVPGMLLVHTLQGLLLLHPATLQPLDVKGINEAKRQGNPAQQSAGNQEEAFDPILHFVGSEMECRVVKIFDVHCGGVEREAVSPTANSESGSKMPESLPSSEGEAHERVPSSASADFGSCSVAFTLDNRLLIVKVSQYSKLVELALDILLPGKVTELLPMGRFGFMLSVTQFPDAFREEVYWLSESGHLLGMLPCLGAGPRSFLYATLAPRPTPAADKGSLSPTAVDSAVLDEGDDGSGLYVFFNDGQGGIVCVRPSC